MKNISKLFSFVLILALLFFSFELIRALLLTGGVSAALAEGKSDALPETELSAAAGIQDELGIAEEILGAPCKLAETEAKMVGSYFLESRLYVLDEPGSKSISGQTGGVLSQVWRDVLSSSSPVTVKVMFSANFAYNGTNALSSPNDSKIWCVDRANQVIDTDLNPVPDHKDGRTAKAIYQYTFGTGVSPVIAGTTGITCSKTGVIGIATEEDAADDTYDVDTNVYSYSSKAKVLPDGTVVPYVQVCDPSTKVLETDEDVLTFMNTLALS